jgi:hypothetical protein
MEETMIILGKEGEFGVFCGDVDLPCFFYSFSFSEIKKAEEGTVDNDDGDGGG